MRAADVCVVTGGGTSTIAGAYFRKPILYFSDGLVVEHNLLQDLPEGKWFVPERGAAIYASVDLWKVIEQAIEVPDTLYTAQEKAFPIPANWDTAPEIAEAILNA